MSHVRFPPKFQIVVTDIVTGIVVDVMQPRSGCARFNDKCVCQRELSASYRWKLLRVSTMCTPSACERCKIKRRNRGQKGTDSPKTLDCFEAFNHVAIFIFGHGKCATTHLSLGRATASLHLTIRHTTDLHKGMETLKKIDAMGSSVAVGDLNDRLWWPTIRRNVTSGIWLCDSCADWMRNAPEVDVRHRRDSIAQPQHWHALAHAVPVGCARQAQTTCLQPLKTALDAATQHVTDPTSATTIRHRDPTLTRVTLGKSVGNRFRNVLGELAPIFECNNAVEQVTPPTPDWNGAVSTRFRSFRRI